MQVILAINYGGRDEILRAFKKFVQEKSVQELSVQELGINDFMQICEKDFSSYMDNPDIPDPDLIIRSAGEFRTSNFLLWQGAYAEIYISQKLWPDWDKSELENAIKDYQKRDRKFGGVKT
jgi:undecaprenyl diphosphate synthase